MCLTLNVFVPVVNASRGPALAGLELDPRGEIQPDFVAWHARERGTYLHVYGGAMCLCGFHDWSALYGLARDLLERNQAPYVSMLRFWSGARYDLIERAVDVDDTAHHAPIDDGEIVHVRRQLAPRRRPRVVVHAY